MFVLLLNTVAMVVSFLTMVRRLGERCSQIYFKPHLFTVKKIKKSNQKIKPSRSTCGVTRPGRGGGRGRGGRGRGRGRK